MAWVQSKLEPVQTLFASVTKELSHLISTNPALSYPDILSLNKTFKTSANPFANSPVVFIAGGTSGIGQALLKAIAKHTNSPRIYFTGRNKESADQVISDVKTLNKDAKCTFLHADFTLLTNVCSVAQQFYDLERLESPDEHTRLNLLSISVGSLDFNLAQPTEEGLPPGFAARHYARHLLTTLLLPALKQGAKNGSAKVLNIEAAGYESPDFNHTDIQLSTLPRTQGTALKLLFQQQVTAASLMAESFAKRYAGSGIEFMHVYPGVVKSGLTRLLPAPWSYLYNWLFYPMLCVSGMIMETEQAGERFFWIVGGGVEAKEGVWLGNWAGNKVDWREKGFAGVEGEEWARKRMEWRERCEMDLEATWGRVLGGKWTGWPAL